MSFRTKEEQVADYLREGIIAGRFPRGARLKQQEIATLLQTSITPVREALKLLAAEGYVAGDSYRGAIVAPFDVSASQETLSLRILLETQLVAEAVSRASAGGSGGRATTPRFAGSSLSSSRRCRASTAPVTRTPRARSMRVNSHAARCAGSSTPSRSVRGSLTVPVTRTTSLPGARS